MDTQAARTGPSNGASNGPSDGPSDRRVFVVLLGVALLGYGLSVADGFYNDDALFLNHAEAVLEQPGRLLTDRPLNYFRPTWSLWVTWQYALFGLWPAGYHAVGVLLHALVGWLVYRLGRRVLGAPGPAFAAGLAFVGFYSHSEGPLWISAHNSVLAAGLCVAAVLGHLRAVERGGWRPALLTALIVLAALGCKEPAAVVLLWLPLSEGVLFGWRSLIGRASWGRGLLVPAAAAAFIASNARIGEAFLSSEDLPAREIRATFEFVTVDGVLGATAWLFSPLRHTHESARWWTGALLLAVVLGAVAVRRREMLGPALLAVALLLSAMIPASMTRFQQVNSSRLYYFPTVGAALLVGIVGTLLSGRRAVTVGAVALIAFVAGHLAAVRYLDHADYRPISRYQTRLAEEVGPHLAAADGHPVLLIEPWIDNLMHMQEFLRLYQDVDPGRVSRLSFDRSRGADWLAQQRRLDPQAALLDTDEQGGLIPATTIPWNRDSAPGNPRTAETGRFAPRFEVLRVGPPRP